MRDKFWVPEITRVVTLGINTPTPQINNDGSYDVVLANLNAQSIDGQLVIIDDALLRNQMDFLTGQQLGQYNFSGTINNIPYGPTVKKMEARIPNPMYTLNGYSLQYHDDGYVTVMGNVTPTNQTLWDKLATNNRGLFFSMRSLITIMGETRKVLSIISFDMERRVVLRRFKG